MKIKYLGHSCFVITSATGIKIITDPFDAAYVSGDGSRYEEIAEAADIVTISHNHVDHSNVNVVTGKPEVVRRVGATEVKKVEFKGIATYHDKTEGSQRGSNIVFCFEVDGIMVCHLGDLGHKLSDEQMAAMGKVDVLLIPVGGYYTIDASVATEVCNQLKPGVIIPMHFKTEKCCFPIAGVEEFLRGKEGVSQLAAGEVELKDGELPLITQIIVLEPQL
jgi:L-ascorbate metabolism protein UlaG (beta-lactamase superfamily)